MSPLVLIFTLPLVVFLSSRCSNACVDDPFDNCRYPGCYNVTKDDQDYFSNGWSVNSAGLYSIYYSKSVYLGLDFLSDLKSAQWKLSLHAYDSGTGEILDVLWQLNLTLELNATLEFQQDGNLVIKSSHKEIIWATNTIGAKRLCITEYASLELQNEKNDSLWSSFESPTNKLVCGQVLKDGMKLEKGNYTFNVEHTRAALFFLQQPYKTWSIPNGKAPNYAVLCCDNDYAKLQLRDDTGNISNGNYLMISRNVSCSDNHEQEILSLVTYFTDASYVAVVTLRDDGIITATELSGSISTFEDEESCDLPNVCSKYGLCTTNGAGGHLCSCPNSSYFQPIENSNSESGCQINTTSTTYSKIKPGKCEMIDLPGIDYYRNNFTDPNTRNVTQQNCSTNCYNNASCKVAFFQRLTNSCFLVNEKSLYSFRSANASYYSASFKVCTPPPPSSFRSSSAVVIATVASVASCLVLLIFILLIYVKIYEDKEEEDVLLNTYLSEATLKRYSSKELNHITYGDEKLGAGAFGTVYKGLLPNGIHVAVKTLNGLTQEAKDFYAELSVLSRVRHFNLVQLLGFCSNKKSRSLIYEYMENGSLDQWLLGKKSSLLSWEARMQIAIGSARGMAYLHEECAERVLHLDVKPQNILLDENFHAKVADFGMSKLVDRNEDAFFMTNVCGTPGYLAPEFLTGEAIGVKCDVYSFGVVLLEIIAGCRPIKPNGEEFWIWSKDDKVIKQIVDRRLGASFNLDEARRMLKVAALCINLDPESRPYMSSVVQMLEGTVEIPCFITAPLFHPNLRPDVNHQFMKLLESRAASSSGGAAAAMSVSSMAPR